MVQSLVVYLWWGLAYWTTTATIDILQKLSLGSWIGTKLDSNIPSVLLIVYACIHVSDIY